MKDNVGSTTAEGDVPARFGRVNPTAEQVTAVNSMRSTFEAIEKLAGQLVKPGRYHSMALSKLEEAHMFFNKAITHEGIKKA